MSRAQKRFFAYFQPHLDTFFLKILVNVESTVTLTGLHKAEVLEPGPGWAP